MIPKIIHQVWIGDDPSEYMLNAMNTVRDENSDFEYIRWDNNSILELNLPKKILIKLNDKKSSMSFLINYIRYVIMSKYGGWYLDTGTVCKESISKLHDSVFENELALIRLNDCDGDLFRYSNGYFACAKNYNFEKLLNETYLHETSIFKNNIFYKNVEKVEIKCSDIGIDGRYLKDLRLGSQKK